MVSTKELMELCEEEDITVMSASCPKSGSMSVMIGDKCYIGIDSSTPENERLERHAHEIGHCVKGAFYNRYSPFDVVSRYEYRADKWAIEKLIPREELVQTLKENVDSIFLLAEHFNVSEKFMIKACKYYGFYNEAI